MAQRILTTTFTNGTHYKSFVDAGGWCALVAKSDKYHRSAVVHNQTLRSTRALLLTSNFVLDETLTRLRYDFGLEVALSFWHAISELVNGGDLQILYVDEGVWDSAVEIFARYSDQMFSFTDCTSFVLAQEAKADEVFGFDAHFRIFGLILNPWK